MSLPAPEDRSPHSYRDDPGVPPFPDDKPLIVFDGHCIFCSRSAQIVLRRDAVHRFRLAAAQSALGQGLYAHYGLDPANPQTSLLIEDGILHVKSDAGMRIARRLGFPWLLLTAGRILPRSFTDWIYDWIARNRFKWFGRSEQCFVPSPQDRERFIL